MFRAIADISVVSEVFYYCIDPFVLFLLITHLYKNTLILKVKTRALLLLTSCISSLYFVNIVLVSLFNNIKIDTVTTLTAIVTALLLVRVCLLTYSGGATCRKIGTFLAYRKPKNVQGYIAALFRGYGSVSIIINGSEFKFKQGVFVESEHVESDRIIYKRIRGVPLERARLMVGTKWKWWHNCFTVILKDISNAERRNTRSCKRNTGE